MGNLGFARKWSFARKWAGCQCNKRERLLQQYFRNLCGSERGHVELVETLSKHGWLQLDLHMPLLKLWMVIQGNDTPPPTLKPYAPPTSTSSVQVLERGVFSFFVGTSVVLIRIQDRCTVKSQKTS